MVVVIVGAYAGAGTYTEAGAGDIIDAGDGITEEAMAGGKFDGGGFDSPMGFIRKLNILYMDIYFIVYRHLFLLIDESSVNDR